MLQKASYKDIASFAWHIWKAQKQYFPLLLLGMGTAAFIDTLFPVVTGKLIGAINATPPGSEGWGKSLMYIFALFVGLEIAYHTIRNCTLFLWNKFSIRALHKILTENFAKVQKFSTDWHANAFAGGTVRKITRGMWSFDVFEDNIFMFLYPTTIVLISTIALMFSRWAIMGWVTLACVSIYVGFSIWAVMTINAPKFRKSADADTKVGAALADAVTGNAAVKAFGAETAEEKRFGEVAERWYGFAINAWQTSNAMDLIRRYLATGTLCMMVGTAVHLWSQGLATAADVVYVLTAYIVMSQYLRHIGEQVSNLQKAMAEMEDIVSYWKHEDDITDARDAQKLVTHKGVIEFDHVKFGYANKGKLIFDNLSVTIREGEKIALVGHSGSGKSTFVKLLQRLYDVNDGEIRIDGQNVARVTQESLRQSMALVPQEPILFHRSIAANIAYGKPEAGMDEIISAAKKAYAHDFIISLPKGYDTLVGERGIKLSGGERQRIAIARAILADAPILILDEATSSLDSLSEHYIQKALAGLMENRTTITIAHRLATIKAVDRILVFEEGRIVEQGTHDALIADPASFYKRLYDMQALDLVGENPVILAAE